MTGARGLKIANIDKLYIFDMQLFMFLYRGIFFDAALLGVLHCYIVTLLRLCFLNPMKKGVKNRSKNSIYKYIYLYILFFEPSRSWFSFLKT